MSFDLRFDDEYIKSVYEKRLIFKKLEEELKADTDYIKDKLHNNAMFYAGTQNYNLRMRTTKKPTWNFIDTVIKNGMADILTISCSGESFTKGCEKLGISKSDRNTFLEFWYHSLYITKKSM